ncbi:MAG: DUF423 domain-containing protein [Bacteroidia bacterium]
MKSIYKTFAKIGFLFAGLAVIFGAFGAHSIKEIIPDKDLQVFETGVKYQFYHAIAIIILSLSYRKLNNKYLGLTILLMILGIFIFSGSLYALSTRTIWGSDSYKFLGAITPIGGLCYILAWFLLLFKGLSSNEYEIGSTENTESHHSHHRKHHRHRHHRHSSDNENENLNN